MRVNLSAPGGKTIGVFFRIYRERRGSTRTSFGQRGFNTGKNAGGREKSGHFRSRGKRDQGA